MEPTKWGKLLAQLFTTVIEGTQEVNVIITQ